MASPLSADARAQINDAAKKISVANDLDPQIQAELQGHMEDKAQAYLSGEEKVAEADALLLVRAHFGKLATIKAMFQRVHAAHYGVSLLRRMLAVFIAMMTIRAVGGFVWLAWWLLYSQPTCIFDAQNNIPHSPWPDFLVQVVWSLTSVLTLWGVLVFRRRRMERGRIAWFQVLPRRWLWLFAVGAATVASPFLASPWVLEALQRVYRLGVFALTGTSGPMGNLPSYFLPAHARMLAEPYADMVGMLTGLVLMMTMAAGALLWIWWCDRSPRTNRTRAYAAAAWLVAQVLATAPNAVMLVVVTVRAQQFNAWGMLLRGELFQVGERLLPAAVLALVAYLLWSRWRRARGEVAA